MEQRHSNTSTKDILKKAFLWMIVFDYLLLAFFLLQLSNLTLNSGTLISLLLVFYNILLTFLCFHRTNNRDSYILYPTLSATLLAFICFLYFFFLV